MCATLVRQLWRGWNIRRMCVFDRRGRLSEPKCPTASAPTTNRARTSAVNWGPGDLPPQQLEHVKPRSPELLLSTARGGPAIRPAGTWGVVRQQLQGADARGQPDPPLSHCYHKARRLHGVALPPRWAMARHNARNKTQQMPTGLLAIHSGRKHVCPHQDRNGL